MRVKPEVWRVFELKYPRKSSRWRKLSELDMLFCDEKNKFAQDYTCETKISKGNKSILVRARYSSQGAFIRAMVDAIAKQIDKEIIKDILSMNDTDGNWEVLNAF